MNSTSTKKKKGIKQITAIQPTIALVLFISAYSITKAVWYAKNPSIINTEITSDILEATESFIIHRFSYAGNTSAGLCSQLI
jgi:hypothetical protein